MKDEVNHREQGQSLVLISIIMISMIALIALAIDGGFEMSNRRKAQNAADAGALAGANALCAANPTLAVSHARDYAVNRNEAASAEISFDSQDITVTTSIPHNTFFAAIFGTELITTTATASAGCYTPCSAAGTLPFTWSCSFPTAGSGNPQTCGIQYGTPALPGQLYVFMDSINSDDEFLCQDPLTHLPAGELDCDLNDDGVNELFGGKDNRMWLNLDGELNPTDELPFWIQNEGYDGEVAVNNWYGNSDGDTTDVFKAVQDYLVDEIVLIPVFDSFCNGTPDVTCPSSYQFGVDSIVTSYGSDFYYHIASFSAFKVTCVSKSSVEYCPGKDEAIARNPGIPGDTKTIEGYFVQLDSGSGRCEGPDAGVHTIYLNH